MPPNGTDQSGGSIPEEPLSKVGVGDDAIFFDEPDAPPLTKEGVDALVDSLMEEERGHGGSSTRETHLRQIAQRKEHQPLPDESLEIVRERLRVRLARGLLDKRWFKDIEWEMTAWRRGIEDAQEDHESPRDEHGLTAAQREWLSRFATKKEGGQVRALKSKQIEIIRRFGLIAIIEILVGKTRGAHPEDVYLPVGTVCGLSPSPCSPEKGGKAHKAYKGKRPPHLEYPNLDLGDLLFSDPELRAEVTPHAHEGITIYRSSVRKDITTAQLADEEMGRRVLAQLGGRLPPEIEGLKTRRLGLADLGKMIVVNAARDNKKFVTLNMGKVVTTDHTIVGMNEVALQHNNYADWWANRRYYDELVAGLAYMCWTAYRSTIERMEAWGYDLLESKGHDMAKVHDIADQIKRELKQQVEDGEHAPLSL